MSQSRRPSSISRCCGRHRRFRARDRYRPFRWCLRDSNKGAHLVGKRLTRDLRKRCDSDFAVRGLFLCSSFLVGGRGQFPLRSDQGPARRDGTAHLSMPEVAHNTKQRRGSWGARLRACAARLYDVRNLCSALLAVAPAALLRQTFKASCFGFGGSSTAFTVIASIA